MSSWKPTVKKGGYIPDEALIDDVLAVADTLGKTPTVAEYQRYGSFSVGTFFNRFDGWLSALDRAGLTPSHLQRTRSESQRGQDRLSTRLQEMDPEDLGLSPKGEIA